MKLKIFLLCLFGISPFVRGASMNFEGNFRSEMAYLKSLGLGIAGQEPSKAYLSARALLQPNLIIDDHFSLRSQWNLLTSSNFTPDARQGLGNGQGAYIFGDPDTTSLVLSRVWLQWVSDFGVLRVGRMPVSWGFGLVWDAGDGIWDDYQTTYDRLEYRLHLGHMIGALAYSKPKKKSLLSNLSDSENYTVYLRYENPEMEVDAGVIFEKQVRSSGQAQEYLTNDPATVASLGFPAGSRANYPSENTVVDFYLKKTLKYFTLGGDVAWTSGSAFDYNSDNVKDDFEAFALLANVTYDSHSIKAFVEGLYASGDSDLNSGRLDGFVILNRNRRAGFLLGRHLLGSQHVNSTYPNGSTDNGSFAAYSDANSYAGLFYIRPGFQVRWSSEWSSGVELVWARKAASASGQNSLGVELDIGTDYQVYKNCNLGFQFGVLFPGKGLGNTSATPFGVRATLGITI